MDATGSRPRRRCLNGAIPGGILSEVRDMFEQFESATQIDRLVNKGLLYQVTERFAEIDLHRDRRTTTRSPTVAEQIDGQ